MQYKNDTTLAKPLGLWGFDHICGEGHYDTHTLILHKLDDCIWLRAKNALKCTYFNATFRKFSGGNAVTPNSGYGTQRPALQPPL